MLTVASSYDLGRFIAGGVSMGAATALYAALQAPDRMAGLLLVRLAAGIEVVFSFSRSRAGYFVCDAPYKRNISRRRKNYDFNAHARLGATTHGVGHPEGTFHRVGPNRVAWPGVLTFWLILPIRDA